MDNILLGVQHCVDILPVARATGEANARFLIHYKQKDSFAKKNSPCRGAALGIHVSFLMMQIPWLYLQVNQVCVFQKPKMSMKFLLEFFPSSSDGCMLLLDDVKLHFFHILYDPSCIISTTSETSGFPIDPSRASIKVLCELGHPYQTIVSTEANNLNQWSEIKCLLWFPRFGPEYGEGHLKELVQTFSVI